MRHRSPPFRLACRLALLAAAVLYGCERTPDPPEVPAETPPPASCDFDPTTAGTIEGQVTWDGEVPEVAPYRAPISPGTEQAGGARCNWPNPNAPIIDPAGNGVAGAVVFLRGIDPRRARPWDHPPARVELRDYQVHVLQGEADWPSGFVRRGGVVTMVSAQGVFHSLQARGDAFFALAFPEPGLPCARRLDRTGVVELSSGAGYFWMRSYLLVTDHPYFTHTDARGRFSLSEVPSGRYDLVCWLPDWHEAGRELDADTGLICRLTFRPPVEVLRPIRLAECQTLTVPFRLPAERFGQK
jgi:hypothetical protein